MVTVSCYRVLTSKAYKHILSNCTSEWSYGFPVFHMSHAQTVPPPHPSINLPLSLSLSFPQKLGVLNGEELMWTWLQTGSSETGSCPFLKSYLKPEAFNISSAVQNTQIPASVNRRENSQRPIRSGGVASEELIINVIVWLSVPNQIRGRGLRRIDH